jgi:hypothetical protein
MSGNQNVRSISPLRRALAWGGVAAIILLAPGCGSGVKGLNVVRGKVTYGGGPWPKGGMINFIGGPRPASAKFDTEGNFAVESFEKQQGLFPGTYKVSVECWEEPPKMGVPNSGKSYIPAKYMNPTTSGLQFTVEAGKPLTDLKFDIPKK